MKIYPAIDLMSAMTVRLEQGRYERKLSYDISPREAAAKWISLGAEYIHVVDLDGAREGRPVNLDVLKDIVSEAKDVPVEIGGGYRSTDDIHKALKAGAGRVIVGSRAFRDRSFAEECVREFSEKVIFSVDAKSGEIMSEGWERSSGSGDIEMIRLFMETCGVKEIIYTDISKDGTLAGPDIANLKRILSAVKVNIISAGGVKTVEHIRSLKAMGPAITGAIIGRALYDGTIDLEEAIDAGKEDNTLS
ncbi:MAG: 1-(5-phosphoribosyl)-5-[(5-phosphoribosylamino)methylideneamino]imidazole-4-carboxamide isomerase [Candidatus Omnitrophica bacterium]|nr:1-(5-phosphoribosyl)-5-[(5-phosphoribosylamino)methylideneamino]imidazole-4-carboxamide isomerase [Candidatus Omnitrophota bacterium]MDD4013391.1 1-(5-phosphoribosyl)-5-[(5-phosphoribosylamino)methylideneamino]imidazole-4-carboxamide isomerase [Candidatus Omnitrophota bacterium]